MRDKKMISRFFICLFALLMIGCATTPTRQEFETADYGSYPEKYEEIIKANYYPRLIDPYSAMYDFYKPVKAWNRLANVFGWVVCGTINAKNRMGGYTGATPFYFLFKNNQIVTYYDSDPAFVGGICQGSGAYQAR